MKEEKEPWLLNRDSLSKFFFYLLILFLPTQFGKHFWPQSSFVQGLRLDYLSPTIYLTDIFIILIILFSVKKIINYIKEQSKINIFIISLFFLSIILGALTSKNPQAGAYGLLKILEYFILGAYTVLIFKDLNKKIFIQLIGIGLVFESLLAFLQIINNGSLNGFLYFLGERYFNSQTPGIANASISGQLFLRPYATFSHPNVLAGYLIIAMLFVLKFKNNISRKFLYPIILIGSSALVLTMSRVAILFWIIYLFFLFCISLREKYKKRSSNKKNTIAILLIAVLFLTIVNFTKSIFIQRFLQTSFFEESVVQREYLIYQSEKMFIKNPVLGVGINNYYNNLEISNAKTLLIQPVHNIFLLTLSETGLVGLAYLLLIFYKGLKKIKLKAINKSSIVLIFSIIFLGMFDHYFLTLQQGQIMILLIFSQAFSAKINK